MIRSAGSSENGSFQNSVGALGGVKPAFPRADARIIADDGDSLHFCSTCAFSQACLSQGMDKRALMDLHVLVEHVGPLHAGDHLFREGDPFEAIAAVRAGTVKTYVVDREGREHVLGFHLPGEVIGLNAIDGDHYPCNAVALDTVMLCRFSFPVSMPANPGYFLNEAGYLTRRVDHDWQRGWYQPLEYEKASGTLSAVEAAGMRTLDKEQRVSYELEQDRRGKTSAVNLTAA